MDPKQKWLAEHLEELENYRGEWIALSGEGVLAHGEDLSEVDRTASSKGPAYMLLQVLPEDAYAL